MEPEQTSTSTVSFQTHHTRPFPMAVTASPYGGWLAVVELGDGASVSRWFETEEEARHYPYEVSARLAVRGHE